MDSILQDLKYAARTLRKSPAFTLIAVVCLSVGIATNTTLFSCMNAIAIRPLPFPKPDELVYGLDHDPGRDNQNSISYPTFLDWKAESRMSDLAANSGRSLTITEGDEPERVQGQLISANLFTLLGIQPQLGRTFRADEDSLGAPGVVIISDALWRRRYGGDSSIINRVISVNTRPYTVVGVMPPRFRFPFRTDMWTPIGPILGRDPRGARAVDVYGRLKNGSSVEQASGEVAAISKRINAQYEPESPFVGRLTTLRSEFVEADVVQITVIMFGAVTLVLIIACANVANLMLTRAAGRQREIAVRAAIGAGRGRIVRQLLTESLILATISGALAIPLTWIGLQLIDRGIPAENPLPWFFKWGIDTPTLLYTFVIAAVTSVAFGLAPALQVSRGRVYDALREGGRGNFGGRSHKMRSALVIGEVALSLVLLVSASLFTRSFFGLHNVSVGFDSSEMLSLRFYMPGQRYDSTASITARANDLVRRVEALPNVVAATASNSVPMRSCCAGSRILIDGQRAERGREPFVNWTGVGGHWFETFGTKLLAGRTFTDLELTSRAPVAVIDQRMADKFWPRGAVGQRFRLSHDSLTSFEVIGVAPNIRVDALDDADEQNPMAFLPFEHLTSRNTALMVRVRSGSPSSIAPSVRHAIREADPAIAVFEMDSMDKVRQLSYWQFKLFSQMFATFGAIALLLAAIGVYGVISYGVSQRTQEIGVRVALGARARDVFGMVLREASWLAGLGVLIGVVGAFGVTRLLTSFLIGVSPTDPISFVGVALFLTSVALFASYMPARRATRIDPLTALRNE